ncbi:MAG TPA: VCBS repeat-containing protein, partial [Polyangia bacterium]
MAKCWRLVAGVAWFVGGASAGCGAPEHGGDPTARADEQTTQTTKGGALTTSLFQPYVAYPTGSWPEAVAIGDLDGDGRNDVALLTALFSDPANDDMVHVFLQDSDGSLKPRVKYSVGGRGTSMDIGDVNGDGRADVVVGIYDATNWIAVLLQNAAGTLDPMVAYPTPNSVQVKIGDFNGDGRLDVAGLGTGLDLFLQTETGALAPPVTYAVPDGGGRLDARDMDGDGRTDVDLVLSSRIAVLLQAPDGTLGAATSYSLTGNISGSAGIAVGDTNSDGRTDVVVSYGSGTYTSFIARFLQNSGGTFDPPVSSPSYNSPSTIVLGDLDADGRKDVLVAHGGWMRLGVYRQSASGGLSSEELYAIPYASNYLAQALAVGDINSDGRLDALIADYNNGLVVLRHVNEALSVAISPPAPGTLAYVGMPLTVGWTVGDATAVAGFDLSMSFNSGTSYTPIAGCTGLPATARSCSWTPTSAFFALVRVTAHDSAANTAFSEATFNAVVPSINISQPTSPQYVGVPTTISWYHNLPPSGTVRVELSRDGGASYETLADAAPISTSGGVTGSIPWTAAGPATSALLRVTSNGPVAASATTSSFSIIAPVVTVTAPAAGATAYTTSSLSVAWTTNVSGVNFVRIDLSRDGGATFQSITASAPNIGTFSGFLPSGPASTNAVVRVTTNGSVVVAGTSGSFTLVQPTAAVSSPPAGVVAYVGAPLAIAWTTNLPATNLVT